MLTLLSWKQLVMGHPAPLEVWSITEGMEQVCKAEAVKIKGKGLSGWHFQTLTLTTSETVNCRVSKQICLLLGTPEESQKGGCKQDIILSNSPDSLECRASSSSVRELCYLPIRYLHCFCIAKVECQAAGPFKSLTFASLWVSFPQASNMSGRMQSQGSWERAFSESWFLYFLDSDWAGSRGFILCSDDNTSKMKTPHDNWAKVLPWRILSMISSTMSSGF